MKKIYLATIPAILILEACSIFNPGNRYDHIYYYTVAVPCLVTNEYINVDYGAGNGTSIDERFIILKTEVVREVRYTGENGTDYIPETIVSVILPDGYYVVDLSNRSYSNINIWSSENVEIQSVQKMEATWFITAVDTLNVNGSNYTVYKLSSKEDMISYMNESKLEDGPNIYLNGVGFSAQTCYTLATNYYVFTVGNSSNAIPAFAASNTNVTVNATTYALHRALEQRYYPSNGKIVVTVNGWTTNTN